MVSQAGNEESLTLNLLLLLLQQQQPRILLIKDLNFLDPKRHIFICWKDSLETQIWFDFTLWPVPASSGIELVEDWASTEIM